MKKVLILAYDFPPWPSVGAQRPYSWCKYLPEFGFEVTCITRHWPSTLKSIADYVKPSVDQNVCVTKEEGYKVVRVPYVPNFRDKILLRFGENRFSVVRKTLTYLLLYIDYLTFAFDNKSGIYFEAEKLIEKEQFDAIIATGDPFILFRYAALLSRKFNLPWIADYRDGWTTNQGGYESGFPFKLLNAFHQIMERKYVQTAIFLTTAAPSYKLAIQKNLPQKNIHVIFNGYTEDSLPKEKKNTSPYFRIGYAGTIYPYQKIDTFFEGLELFLQAWPNPNLKICFWGIGSPQSSVLHKMKEYQTRFPNFVEFAPKLQHTEVLSELANCNLLLLLSAPQVDTLATKLFDYLALKRKVILVEDDKGIMHSIIQETNAGVMCKNAHEVKDVLENEYRDFNGNNLIKVQPTKNETKYSRKHQTAHLAKLINENL